MIRRLKLDNGRTVVLTGEAGTWDVTDEDGNELGTVREYETRFNLRRVIVISGWRAYPADGVPQHLTSPRRVSPDGSAYASDYSCFNTLREAVSKLVAHMGAHVRA